jgi:phage/plasmid-associated DNA primase
MKVDETRRIMEFCLSELRTTGDGAKVPIEEVYDAYKAWVAEQGQKTKVSIDSFGKRFPKHYKREFRSIMGVTHRVVMGVSLK